jgi:hypothetical protein
MPQPDHDKPQADKFRDMARELEADETPSVFEDAVRKVVAAPIPPKEAKPKNR